jgi:hypothetical protein
MHTMLRMEKGREDCDGIYYGLQKRYDTLSVFLGQPEVVHSDRTIGYDDVINDFEVAEEECYS